MTYVSARCRGCNTSERRIRDRVYTCLLSDGERGFASISLRYRSIASRERDFAGETGKSGAARVCARRCNKYSIAPLTSAVYEPARRGSATTTISRFSTTAPRRFHLSRLRLHRHLRNCTLEKLRRDNGKSFTTR